MGALCARAVKEEEEEDLKTERVQSGQVLESDDDGAVRRFTKGQRMGANGTSTELLTFIHRQHYAYSPSSSFSQSEAASDSDDTEIGDRLR